MPIAPISKVIRRIRGEILANDESGLSDAELLDCFIKDRDDAAFAALMRRHAAMVWGVCSRVLGGHQDTEDAFQATFLVLVRRAAAIVPREMVANWLYGVAHLTSLKARATGARRRTKERQVTRMPEPSVSPNLWDDLQPLLDQELARLPAKFRSAVVLCDLEGKTRKEAARQLKLPEGTVASRLATARTMLAKRLSQRGLMLSGGALAVVLSQNVGSAGAPTAVVSATIEAASLFAAGSAAATGAIPVKVAALTEGVLKTMQAIKFKIASAAIIALFIAGGGVSAWLRSASAVEPNATPSVVAATSSSDEAPRPSDEANNPKNGDNIVGSGKMETKEFPVSKFSTVDAGATFHVEITQAEAFKVSVTSDDNVLPYIKVNNENGKLMIVLSGEHKSFQNATFKAQVSLPALDGLELSGASKATLKGIKCDKTFKARLTGVSEIDGELNAQKATFELDGATHIKVKGSANTVSIKGSGASHFPLADFAVENADVHLSGACKATVNAKKNLDYSLSGACSLHYVGNPSIGRHESVISSSASRK
jgi:RNA polymerase sigma factor (sigma-70 family)